MKIKKDNLTMCDFLFATFSEDCRGFHKSCFLASLALASPMYEIQVSMDLVVYFIQ